MNNLQRLWDSQINRDLLSKQNCRLVIRKMLAALWLVRPCGHDKSQVERLMCITKSEVFYQPTVLICWSGFGENTSVTSRRRPKLNPHRTGSIFALPRADVQQSWACRKMPCDKPTINLNSRCNYWWKAIKLVYIRGVSLKRESNCTPGDCPPHVLLPSTQNGEHFHKAYCSVRFSKAQARLPLCLPWTASN